MEKLKVILKEQQCKEIFPWVNSKVKETFKNKYGLEVTVLKDDVIEKENRSIEKQAVNIDRMYDLISNLENLESFRPEMVASDWMASGNVENDLRAHRLDAKNNLLKILEAKEKELDDEIRNKEIEGKRKYSSLEHSLKISKKLFQKEAESVDSGLDFESKENISDNILTHFQ